MGEALCLWESFFLILVTKKFEMTIVAGKSVWVAIIMVTIYFVGYQKNGNKKNGSHGCKQSTGEIKHQM
jgi:hypothetical protein